ncbi:MAG TPA: hypothetical protein VFZ63_18095 [Jiangellaceae bacterium]
MPTRREILEDVAAGRLHPTEAAALLDESDEAEPESERPTAAAEGAGTPAPPALPAIERIEVRATSRRVRLLGDPSVREFAVDGPHQVRREGSTLHITGDTQPMPTDDTFVLITGGRFREVADRLQRGLGQNLELTVRVRPDLAVGAEVIAGSLHTEGVRGLDHVRATAASLRVQDAEAPLDLLVQAGSAQVTTRQNRGRSRIRCESGSLTLKLLEGTDARVRHDVQLGKFSTQPEQRTDRDLVIGTGAAEIDVEVVMGAVTVVTPS